jgi:hypothetical protein
MNGRGDAVGARRLFSAAHHAIAEALRLGIAAETAIYWQAVLHEGIAALVAGDNVGAEAELDRIVAAGKELPATLQLTELEPSTVARAHVQRGVARLLQEKPVDAATDFGRALDAAPLLPEAEARMALDLLHEAADAIAGRPKSGRAELNARLAERDREIADLKRAVDAIASGRTELNAQLAERDREIVDLTRAIDALKSSSSWRMTAPIRKMTTGLRRLDVFSGR